MTTTQKKQTAFAWAKYYEEVNETHELLKSMYNIYEEHDTEYLTKQLKDCFIELKKKIDCPICLEVIELEDLKISSCGHKYCNSCYEQLMKMDEPKCALCKKKLWTKKKK